MFISLFLIIALLNLALSTKTHSIVNGFFLFSEIGIDIECDVCSGLTRKPPHDAGASLAVAVLSH